MRTPISHSRIQAAQCPYLFKGKFDKRDKDLPQALPLRIGGEAHEIIARYLRFVSHPEVVPEITEYDPATAIAFFIQKFGNLVTPESEEAQVLRRFAKTHTFTDLAKAGIELELAVNEKWEPCAWMAPDVWFRAKVDLVQLRDDMLYITDWKMKFAPDALDGKTKLQLLIYWVMWAVTHQSEIPSRCKVDIEYLRSGVLDSPVPFQDAPYSYDLADIERGKAAMVQASDRIERMIAECTASGEWPCVQCDQCGICPFYAECPLIQSFAANDYSRPVVSADEAIDFLSARIALTRKLSAINDGLRAWTKVSGPVTAAGFTAGYHPVERKVYPLLTVGKALIEMADAWPDVAAKAVVGSSSIAPMLNTKTRAVLAEHIEPLTRTETVVEFGVNKAVNGDA